MPRKPKPFTKEEALRLLGQQLRKGGMSPSITNRTLLLYGRIAGWGLRPRQADTNLESSKETSIQKQVIAHERKLREQAKESK
jgi:hypothetical protein